jgi:hypothetical protein
MMLEQLLALLLRVAHRFFREVGRPIDSLTFAKSMMNGGSPTSSISMTRSSSLNPTSRGTQKPSIFRVNPYSANRR